MSKSEDTRRLAERLDIGQRSGERVNIPQDLAKDASKKLYEVADKEEAEEED